MRTNQNKKEKGIGTFLFCEIKSHHLIHIGEHKEDFAMNESESSAASPKYRHATHTCKTIHTNTSSTPQPFLLPCPTPKYLYSLHPSTIPCSHFFLLAALACETGDEKSRDVGGVHI